MTLLDENNGEWKEEVREVLNTRPCILKFLIEHGYGEFCRNMYNDKKVSFLEEIEVWELLETSIYFRGYLGKNGERINFYDPQGKLDFYECEKMGKTEYDISLQEHFNVWDSATDETIAEWKEVDKSKINLKPPEK